MRKIRVINNSKTDIEIFSLSRNSRFYSPRPRGSLTFPTFFRDLNEDYLCYAHFS